MLEQEDKEKEKVIKPIINVSALKEKKCLSITNENLGRKYNSINKINQYEEIFAAFRVSFLPLSETRESALYHQHPVLPDAIFLDCFVPFQC